MVSPEATQAHARSPWRSPRFRMYYAGQAISFLGDGVVPMTFIFAALAVSQEGWALPATLLALWVSRMTFMSLGGSWADKLQRSRVMLGADVVRIVAQMIPIIAFMTHSAGVWHLILSAAIYGAGTAFYIPASVALLPELVPEQTLPKANSALDVAMNIGLLAGPALASLLVALGGVPLALGVDVATFMVSVLCLARITESAGPEMQPLGHEEDDEEDPGSFADSLRQMRGYPRIWALILAWCPAQLGVAAISVLGPIIAKDQWGDPAMWATVATALAAGGLLGAFLAGWVDVTWGWLLVLGSLMLCVPLELVVLVEMGSVWVVAVVFGLASLVMGIAGVVFDTLVQRSVPSRMLARVGSVEQTLIGAMVPFGLAITLPISHVVGTDGFLLGIAALTIVIGCIAGALLGPRNSEHTTVIEES